MPASSSGKLILKAALTADLPLGFEYAAINSMLDQISSCLDHLEEKNDHLHACLKELLESNRQTRLEFQQQSEQHSTAADMQGPRPPV
uniref:Uncharacterized protein n=1 Tax=Pavo cristatus TaxID=9049 RepID=A0A8C9ETY7_PAVCR